MKPSDLSRLRMPGVPALSPDGRNVVVAVRRIDLDADDYTSQLWAVPADGSEPVRRLTHGWRDSAPAWSPDGRWLAFSRCARGEDGKVGRPQLYVMPADGGEPRRLTDHPLGAGPAVWSPDSHKLAHTARVPEPGRYGTADGRGPDREPPRRITRLAYRRDDIGFTCDRPSRVWLVDVTADDPEPVQVTGGDFDDRDVSFSPDGTLLAFTSARHERRDDDLVRDLWTCHPDGSGLRRVTRGEFGAGAAVFTPDGAGLCFTGWVVTDPPEVNRNVGVWTVPVDGSAPARRLTDPERYHLANALHSSAITAHPDGVLFPNEHRGQVQLLLVPFGGGEPRVLLDGRRQALGADHAAGRIAVTLGTAGNPGEVWILDPPPAGGGAATGGSAGVGAPTSGDGSTGGGDRWRRITDFGASLAGVELFQLTELDGVASDGYPVHGWLVRPGGPGPHPVLLAIHGGPFTQYGWNLFDEAQVYAGAGYAVVLGNPRGSSGYGEAHGRAVVGDVAEVSARDLLPLLDGALDLFPDLDRDRVGVLGGSHGGFMATWLAAHHGDRFRAAVSERAVNAIDSFAGTSDIGWWFADALYGTDPDRHERQSPLCHADRIRIPMMIIHSEHDWRCPVEQAQRLFVALKRRGVPVEMLLFPGEGHELSRTGLPSHRVARFEAILDWFDRHLRAATA